MKKEKSTTVNLWPIAQAVKDDWAPVYGLKNILSAGLVLFGQLNEAEQALIIRIANSDDDFGAGALAKRVAPKPSDKPKTRVRQPKTG